MKTTMMVLFGMIAATTVKADGFKCIGENSGLNFKMYNHTDSSEGTRNAAVMIISDPSVNYGNKTIVAFDDTKSTLKNNGATYNGKVDLRVIESSRKGELIAGTKLGELSTIIASVAFNYYSDTPSVDGEQMKGRVIYYKRNGDQMSERLICTRYKKN